MEAEAAKEVEESGGAVSGKPRGEKGLQKEVQRGSSSFRERSDDAEAEERPVGLAVGDSGVLGLAPTSTLLGPQESPDSVRLSRRFLLNFSLAVMAA